MGYLENLWNALDFGSLWDLLLRLVSVFLCLTVHETCHGLAALALGDPTAKRARRLSLNPLRHIDWFGLLMMVTVGFGWAKPVPVDPRYFRRPKQGMALTGRCPTSCWRWCCCLPDGWCMTMPRILKRIRGF